MIHAEIERCAGIDVGKERLAVCVMIGPLAGEPRVEIRDYGTTVAELERLRDWLRQQGVTHVVMESTGSYWKPIFNVLEETVQVYLANPQEVKNRKGYKCFQQKRSRKSPSKSQRHSADLAARRLVCTPRPSPASPSRCRNGGE